MSSFVSVFQNCLHSFLVFPSTWPIDNPFGTLGMYPEILVRVLPTKVIFPSGLKIVLSSDEILLAIPFMLPVPLFAGSLPFEKKLESRISLTVFTSAVVVVWSPVIFSSTLWTLETASLMFPCKVFTLFLKLSLIIYMLFSYAVLMALTLPSHSLPSSSPSTFGFATKM